MAGIRLILLAVAALLLWIEPSLAGTMSSDGSVLREIRQRGVLRCGVSLAPGLASHDSAGRPAGMMADLCRALAAAALGNAEAIEMRPVDDVSAIETGDVDVSFATTAWTLTSEASHPLEFVTPIYFDEQVVAAWRPPDAHPQSPANSAVPVVCVPAQSAWLSNLDEYLHRTNRNWAIRSYPSWDKALQGFLAHECSSLSGSRLLLSASIESIPEIRGKVAIDGDVLAEEPVAAVVARSDRRWLAVVRWTVFALVLAEENDLTAANAAAKRGSGDEEVRRMLAGVPGTTEPLGLGEGWAYDVIAKVGNYGEIFDRNLGSRSPLHMERGPNRPWTEGGRLYPYVFQ